MSAHKTNIRSFRYSDAVARALEEQPGDSLNEKFERLVISCAEAVPAKQRELDALEGRLLSARRELADVMAHVRMLGDLRAQLAEVQAAVTRVGATAAKLEQPADCVRR